MRIIYSSTEERTERDPEETDFGEAAEYIKTARESAEKICRYLDRLEEIEERNYTFGDVSPEEIEEAANAVRQAAAKVFFNIGSDVFYTADRQKIPAGERDPDAVYGFISGDAVFLKCGMLPVNLFQGSVSNNKIRKNFYCAAVRKKMEELLYSDPEKPALDYEKHTENTFQFLFVYGTADEKKAADSDNHYIRKIINEISFFLPGGDTGTSTSVLLETAATDRIPAGTYIAVVPGGSRVFTKDELAEVWERYFRTALCPAE